MTRRLDIKIKIDVVTRTRDHDYVPIDIPWSWNYGNKHIGLYTRKKGPIQVLVPQWMSKGRHDLNMMQTLDLQSQVLGMVRQSIGKFLYKAGAFEDLCEEFDVDVLDAKHQYLQTIVKRIYFLLNTIFINL